MRQGSQSMLRIVAVRGPSAPQPRRWCDTWGTGSPECAGHRHPAPHGGTRRCRPTILYGLPIWFVGRDLCVPPLVRTAGKIRMAPGHRPTRAGPGAMALRPGVPPSADGGLGRWGISRRARRGYFARCGGRPGAPPPGPLRFFEKNRVKLLNLGILSCFIVVLVRWF